MAQIPREVILAFERQAAARDRMPVAVATSGRVYSSFLSGINHGMVYWYTNDRGDLILYRFNALAALNALQRWGGATVDHYWGSQTRTRLLQMTGLANQPAAVSDMRRLLEASILQYRHGGQGSVVLPMLTTLPPSANEALVEGSVGDGGDQLLYWDGSRGPFPGNASVAPAAPIPASAPQTAPPPGNTPPAPPAPLPADHPPPVPQVVMGRIAIVVRAPAGTVFTMPTVTPPLVMVGTPQVTDNYARVVADAPDGFATSFVMTIGGRPYTLPGLVFHGNVQQNIECSWTPTDGLRLVSNRSVPIGQNDSTGQPTGDPTPPPVQQASMFGNPLVLLGLAGFVMGGLYLIDRARNPDPEDRMMRRV